MEIVTLRAPITFRIAVDDRSLALTSKTFRGKRESDGTIPSAKDLVSYRVNSIVIDSQCPWFDIEEPILVQILWANVLSVQYEK